MTHATIRSVRIPAASAPAEPLTEADLRSLDRYWRVVNYLAAGQIYLMTSPLLKEPLRPEHVKPRLLGHWGTSPGGRRGDLGARCTGAHGGGPRGRTWRSLGRSGPP
jgi:hypothetical protein